MSKYTSELRYICESLTGHSSSVGYDDIDDVIDDAIPLIFSFTFPIFDETYRNVLCTKILRHYYTREIGLETYGLWKLKLQTKLNEIMPYYNKLYESELFRFNPLYDVDMTTTNVGRKTGESTDIGKNKNTIDRNTENKISEIETNNDNSNRLSTDSRENTAIDSRTNTSNGSKTKEIESDSVESVNNSATKRDLYSDTPQGALTGVDSETYLTNARKITDDIKDNKTGVSKSSEDMTDSNTETSRGDNIENSTGNSSETSTSENIRVNNRENNVTGQETNDGESTHVGSTKNTEDYVMHVIGKSAGSSYSKMIKEFRDNLLNIDMDIIRELSELFMLIW